MAGQLSIFIDFLYEMWAYQYPKTVGTMFILWLVFLCTKVECTVDFGWILCHFIVGLGLTLQYADIVNIRGWLSLGLLFLWFLRLGGHLFVNRVLTGYKDKRYEDMAKDVKWKGIFFLF